MNIKPVYIKTFAIILLLLNLWSPFSILDADLGRPPLYFYFQPGDRASYEITSINIEGKNTTELYFNGNNNTYNVILFIF